MSKTDNCQRCQRTVDPGDDPDCYDSEGQCFCETCRDRQLEEGRALAAEHQVDRDAARQALDDQESLKLAGRAHLVLDGKSVTCPRCKQEMPDRDSAEGCEDLVCPFIGGDK